MHLLKTILEALSYNAPGDWVVDGLMHRKLFEVDGSTYLLACKEEELENELIIELSFAYVDAKGQADFGRRDAQLSPKTVNKILATVINSTLEKFPTASVLFFTSKNDQGRASLYRAIAERVARNLGGKFYERQHGTTTIFAAVRVEAKFDPDRY